MGEVGEMPPPKPEPPPAPARPTGKARKIVNAAMSAALAATIPGGSPDLPKPAAIVRQVDHPSISRQESNIIVSDKPFEPLGGWRTGEYEKIINEQRKELERLLEEGYSYMETDPEKAEELFAKWRKLNSTAFNFLEEHPRLKNKQVEQESIARINDYLERFGAEFVTALQLPSGLRINIFQNTEGSSQRLEVDANALGDFINHLIETVEAAPESHFKTTALRFVERAKSKMLNTVLINVVISTKEKSCISSDSRSGFIENDTFVDWENDIYHSGICQSHMGNQEADRTKMDHDNIAISIARFFEPIKDGWQKNVNGSLISKDEDLYLLVLAHEFYHAILSAESQLAKDVNPQKNSVDTEHALFVDPLTLLAYDPFRSLIQKGETRHPFKLVSK